MKNITKAFFVVSLISGVYANQESTQTISVPEIEVVDQAQSAGGQQGGSGASAVVRVGEDFYAVESKDVISTSELQNRSADHITELLQNIPGVSITGGTTPQYRRTSIRGMSGFRVIQLVDGARRYETSQSAMSSEIGIEAESLKKVEVEKGADSLTKATGAIGGTVAYETISAKDMLAPGDKLAARVRVGYSSATSSTSQSVTTAAKVVRDTNLLLQAIWRNIEQTKSGGDEVQKSEVDFSRRSYMAKVDHRNRLGSFDIKASHTRTENKDTSYSSSYSDSATTDYNDTTNEITLNHSFRSERTSLINLKNNFYINKRKSERDTHTPLLGFQSTVGKIEDDLSQFGGKIANRAVIPFSGSVYLESEVGIDYSSMKVGEDDGSEMSIYGESEGSNQGLFAMNNLSLLQDKLVLRAGARVSRYDRESSKLAIDVPSVSGSTFSHTLGLTVRPLKFMDVFAKVSQTNRAPEVRELYYGGGRPFACHFPRKICNNMPNSSLREEEAYGREIGLSFHHSTNIFSGVFKVSYFHEKMSDYIETAPFMYKIVNGEKVAAGPMEATHRDYMSMNMNKVIRSGIEAQLGLSAYDFDFSAKYSAMNMDCLACPVMYDASSVKEPLFTTPADKLVLTLGHHFRSLSLEVGYRGEFIDSQKRLSQRYINAGYATPGYSVHGAYLGWEPTFDLTGKFRVDFAVDNLSNKKYMVHNSGSGAWELGQNYRLALSKYF